MINQIIFNPTFPKGEFEKEIKVINQEFQNKWANPQNRFYYKEKQNLFGTKNIINRDGIGQPEFIKEISQSQLINLHKKFFQPQNTTTTIVGNFDKNIENNLKNIFNKYPNTFKTKPIFTKNKTQKKYLSYQDKVDQSYLNINWIKNKKYSFQERLALNIISFMIASSSNSLLYKKLRHETGLVYDINSCCTNNTANVQNFEIWSSFHPSKTDQIIKIIKEEVEKFLIKPITIKDLNKNRHYMNLQTLMSFDSIPNISYYLNQYLFYEGKTYTPEEIINICQKITPKQIYQLSWEMLDPKNMTISIMTPNKK